MHRYAKKIVDLDEIFTRSISEMIHFAVTKTEVGGGHHPNSYFAVCLQEMSLNALQVIQFTVVLLHVQA